ncbi:MAG: RagB/SusD family nutrient uptake outer membrane protein [Chitinophagaceae bacterium]
MKNKLFCFLALSLVVVTAGCKKDFLEDMKSYDKFDESMFESEDLTGFYIDRLYNWYFATYNSPSKTLVGVYNDDRRNLTEEFGGTVHNYINPNKTLKLASEAPDYYGPTLPGGINNHSYTRIRAANLLIEKIDGTGKALSESFRKTAKGQMYFLRAIQYFELARVYGGVPIVTTVQNASADDPSIRLPRPKTSEVFAQVIKDLDSAISMLPMKWDAVNYGRLSAAGALAMKSRVLLTAASPLFNADWDNAGNDKWQKALDAGLAAETALTAAGYGASINSAKDWAEVTFKNDNAFNGEALIVQLLSANTSLAVNNGWENSIRPKDHNGGGGIAAPKQMLDLFPLATGLRPTPANGYVDTFFFENRDPRFYRTFAFSGVKWGLKNNANKVTWFYRWKANAAATSGTFYANNQTNSPAIVRKMSNPNADSTAYNFSGTDIFEYRYGELLLNIAEAYAGKGDIANAVLYLGKVRKRVGIPSANNYGIGTLASKYAALEACIYERRVELAYEGKRFWDMQRWMLYADDASISDDTNAKLGIPALNGTSRQGYYWQVKTYGSTDPIPASERNISIDPDGTSTAFAAEIAKLKTLYQNRLVMTPLDQAWDRDGTTPVNILFRPNYYVFGYTNAILSNNPWLPQTKGWSDYNGAEGTYNYRE